MRMGWHGKIIQGTTAAMLATTLLTSCAGNPATGGADLVITSQGGEVSIGEEMHQKMIAEGAAYDDAELAGVLAHEIGHVTARHHAGKKADLTVLMEGPYQVGIRGLKDIEIWGTLFEGELHPLTSVD